MELKKSNSVNQNRFVGLLFLIGLNITLLLVYIIFQWNKDITIVKKDRIYTPPTTNQNIYIVNEPEIAEVLPEEVKLPEPTLPDEEIILVEETQKPVESKVLKPIDKIKLPVVDFGNNKGNSPRLTLEKLREEAKNVKEAPPAEPLPANAVDIMAIYPGCEKFSRNNKKLIQCFADKLGQDIRKNLDEEYPNAAMSQPNVKVRLLFNVSTTGEIVNIKPVAGDEVFKPQAKEALEQTIKGLEKKNKKIKPAKMLSGEKASIIFSTVIGLSNPNY